MAVCVALFGIGGIYIVAHALYIRLTTKELFNLNDFHYFGLRVIDFCLAISMLMIVSSLKKFIKKKQKESEGMYGSSVQSNFMEMRKK